MNRVAGAILFNLLAAAAPAAADDLKEIGCGRSLEKDGALPRMVMDNGLHVLDQAGTKFDAGMAPARGRAVIGKGSLRRALGLCGDRVA